MTARWIVAGCTLALGAALLAGCQGSQRRDRGREALSRPVAMVNTEAISLEDFQTSYQKFLARWDRFLRSDEQKNRELKGLHLQQLIEGKLLDQEARRKGIEISLDALLAKVRESIAPYGESYLEQAAEVVHAEVDEWNRDYLRRMVHDKLVRQEVVDRIQVTDQEVRTYYDEHRAEFTVPEQVRVRHLAVGNRKVYERVRRHLRNDADFIELIRQYSTTPDRFLDGDLGYVERGVLPPEFDDVIFRMSRIRRINRLDRPVQTQMGYHIFRLEGRKEERKLPLREASPMIRASLVHKKQSAAYAIWLQRLKERATITIDDEMLGKEVG